MSIVTETVISSTQTAYDTNIEDHKQIITVFDENEHSYELLAWHSCPNSSNFHQRLIILVKGNTNESSWLGTLTATTTTELKSQTLTWKNHLYQRQHQLRLSKDSDSIIIHFEIQERMDVHVSKHK